MAGINALIVLGASNNGSSLLSSDFVILWWHNHGKIKEEKTESWFWYFGFTITLLLLQTNETVRVNRESEGIF